MNVKTAAIAIGALVVLGMAWQLKVQLQKNGELRAKLETQVAETLECTSANTTNQDTITTLENRITVMIEERRVDAERRELVLVERSQQLARALARNAELEQERENEQETNQDCADLTSLSLDFFCPATAHQLRQRTIGAGGDGDPDG
ncbi:MAG: hypothetical protein ACYTBS_07435 [Planctomycetota bacterium]